MAIATNLLNYGLLMILPQLRQTLQINTHRTLDPTKLPSFHDHGQGNWAVNYRNSQLMQKPSDTVFIMHERDFNSLGRRMKRSGLEYKLRLSNNPIWSNAFGDQQQVYWALFSFNSLLCEPMAKATYILLVTVMGSWAHDE